MDPRKCLGNSRPTLDNMSNGAHGILQRGAENRTLWACSGGGNPNALGIYECNWESTTNLFLTSKRRQQNTRLVTMARDAYDRDPTFKPKAFTEPPCQAQVVAPPAALKKDPAEKGRPPCQPTKSQLLKEPPTDHERDMGRQSERALDPGLQKSGGWTMSSDRLPGKLVHHVFDYATISTRRVPEFVGGSVCCVNRNGTFRQSSLTNRSMVEAQNDKITQPCAVMRIREPNETVAQIT